VLDLVSSVLCQEIGQEERLQNDLFCVEWDVKPLLSQSVSSLHYWDVFGSCVSQSRRWLSAFLGRVGFMSAALVQTGHSLTVWYRYFASLQLQFCRPLWRLATFQKGTTSLSCI